jgi:hypothetical protein
LLNNRYSPDVLVGDHPWMRAFSTRERLVRFHREPRNRRGHLAVRLPHNGAVLILGGMSGDQRLPTAELLLSTWDPAAGSWRYRFESTGSMTLERDQPAVAALAVEGRLLAAGGAEGSAAPASAELYGFPTVKTDKEDYAPGETVQVTGTGWEPGQNVSLCSGDSDPRRHVVDRYRGQTRNISVPAGRAAPRRQALLSHGHDFGSARWAQATFTVQRSLLQCERPEDNDVPDDCESEYGGLSSTKPPTPRVTRFLSACSTTRDIRQHTAVRYDFSRAATMPSTSHQCG